jgi:hypothetical protein
LVDPLVVVLVLVAGACQSEPWPPDSIPALRTTTVDGIEVAVHTYGATLPDRATEAEFPATVIDDGEGAVLCMWTVNASLPPSCDGPVIDDMELGEWAEEEQGVRWGERNVIVTWPPVDGRVELVSHAPFAAAEVDYPHNDRPAECDGINAFVDRGAIGDYSEGLGPRSGGLYVTNDDVLVLQVTDDPAPHRAALADGDRQACVVQVAHTEIERNRIRFDLEPMLEAIIAYVTISSSGTAGRLEVHVPVADVATVGAIDELADEPAAIRVIGWAVLPSA